MHNQDKLENVRNRVREMRDIEVRMDQLEEQLSQTKKEHFQLIHNDLPDLFSELNIDKLGLPAEGNLPAYDVELKPFYQANIAVAWPEEKRAEAFNWLEQNGAGDLIKTTLTINFGREQSHIAQQLKESLEKQNYEVKSALTVSHQTLTAFVKEQIERHHETPPLDVLGAQVGLVVRPKKRRSV